MTITGDADPPMEARDEHGAYESHAARIYAKHKSLAIYTAVVSTICPVLLVIDLLRR